MYKQVAFPHNLVDSITQMYLYDFRSLSSSSFVSNENILDKHNNYHHSGLHAENQGNGS